MKKYLLILAVCLTACSDSGHSLLNELTDVKGVSRIELNHIEELRVFENDQSYFSDLLILDSLLVVNKLLPNPYFYTIYDLKNKDSVRSLGRQGQGPEEFSSFSIAASGTEHGRVLQAMVPNEGGVVYTVNLDSLLNSGNAVKRSAMLGYGPGRFVKNGNYYYVTEKEGRISKTDTAGNVLESGLKYPFEDTNREIPPELLHRAYEGQMIRQPGGDRVALATFNSPNFDIFSTAGAIESVSQMHISAPRIFDESGDLAAGGRITSISFSDMTPMGFVDITANKDYIFLLYSGKTYKEFGDDAEYADLIYVLDWDGNIINELKLAYQTRQLVVDEPGEYLYTLVETEEEYFLRKHSLKDIG